VLALLSLWFRQLREAEVNKLDGALTLPEKHHLLEALQRLPISFGMAMRVRCVRSQLTARAHMFYSIREVTVNKGSTVVVTAADTAVVQDLYSVVNS
jgi:hypothetical protein